MSEQTLEQRFVAAWGEIKNPELDGANKHFNNRYATLKSTIVVVREACKAHGIAYMQRLERGEGGYMLKSSVTDGRESVPMSEFPVGTPANPQVFGSNLTYAKRQQAQSDWCITGEEDDDGNAAAADACASADARKDRAGRPAGKKDADDSVKRAWNRLLAACAAYEKKHGMEPKKAVDGVKARPDYPDRSASDSEKAEFFTLVAEEFESEL
ncbi:MAG: hypothetical protein E7C06_04390 [Eggerthella lenta]|nr:hypothetical protein [Eggerthella lenta]